jgi:hypothetical protein
MTNQHPPAFSLLSNTRIVSKAASCANASIAIAPAGPAPMIAIDLMGVIPPENLIYLVITKHINLERLPRCPVFASSRSSKNPYCIEIRGSREMKNQKIASARGSVT